MSLLNDQALWQGKFFNGQWQAASQSREAVEVATGQVLGAIGYADGRDLPHQLKPPKPPSAIGGGGLIKSGRR